MSNSDQVAALRQAVELSPDNPPLRRALADALAGDGRHSEAESEYRAALRLTPNDVALKRALAATFMEQEKFSEALVLLEQHLESAPEDTDARLMLCRLHVRRGEADLALPHYRSAVDADPAAADAELADAVGHSTYEESDESEFGGRVPVGDPVFYQLDDDEEQDLVRSDVTFADVGGMEDLKEQVRMKVIHPIQHADLFAAYGKGVGGGLLMYGPPGCGKTHLARATAGEIDAAFLSVGIEDVLDMWLGQSEQKLHILFEQARRNQPAVLFFDEVDALGGKRSDLRQSAGRNLVNQFLSELDGIGGGNDGVLVMAATNAPWALDGAFRRPGRFDRVLFVPPPDEPARKEVLKIQLRDRPLGEIDYEKVARKTKDFTGADLKAVCDRAVEAKLSEALKTGRPEPLTTRDLLSAVKSHKPTAAEWLASARNHAIYGNEGGAYDEILDYLGIKK